jgi:hypothetical protein
MAAGESYGELGFALLDAAAATIRLGVVQEDANLSGLRTLVMQTAPSEILIPNSTLTPAALRCLKDPSFGAVVTSIPRDNFPTPSEAAGVLTAKQSFNAVADAVCSLPAAERPPEALAALVGLLEHLQRMKLLDMLSACSQVRRFFSGVQH